MRHQASRDNLRVPKCFGHVGSMDFARLMFMVMKAEISEGRVGGH